MADPFSVFTAGRVGERAIEESRFRRGLDIQQQSLGLQERGLDIQERGQAAQVGIQQQQEERLQAGQDLETAEGRLEAGLERIRMIASLEASRRLLADNNQDDPGIGQFLETQGGLEQSLKFAGLNKDQFELMVLREKDRQQIEQRTASQQTIGAQERIVEQTPEGVETIVPPVETPAKPRTESEIRASIDEKILAGGIENLSQEETQLVSLDLAQNPLGQFALGTGQSLSELIGGGPPTAENPAGTPALSKRERDIMQNVLDDLGAGDVDINTVVDLLKENKDLSDDRKRAIAAAIGVGLFAQ